MNTKKLVAVCLTGALIASAMTGCGINKNATAASFADGTTVKMEVANFAMRYQQASTDALYRQILGDNVWSQDVYGNGTTLEANTKDDILETLHEMYTLKLHMSDKGVSLTAEETKAITDAATAFLAANDTAAIKEIGATQAAVEELLTLHTIQNKMRAAIIAEADTNVSEEEANMRAYTMLKFSTEGTYDEEYNYIEPSEEDIVAIKQQAADVFAEIASPADLDTVAEAHELETTSGTYAADNTSLEEEVKTALDALQEGEMSELITTDSALYILRLDAETDEEATEDNRQSIIEDRQDELYDETLAGWQENDGWEVETKQISKIEFKNTFSQPEAEEADDITEDTEITDDVEDVIEDSEVMEDTEE